MKRAFAFAAVVALLATPAFAQVADHYMGNMQIKHGIDMATGQVTRGAGGCATAGGGPGGTDPINPWYDNADSTSFLGSGLTQGPSAVISGNRLTRMLMDEVHGDPIKGGLAISCIEFTMGNFNTDPVTVRPRIRYWFADGAAGGGNDPNPGTYYNKATPAATSIGFTFGAITVAANTCLTVFSTGFDTAFAFQWLTPDAADGNVMWAGLTYDDNTGATGATAAQMDNMGQCLYDPPVVGSSHEEVFITNAAGSFFNVANPAGTIVAPGFKQPPFNLGLSFYVIPEPMTLSLLGLGAAALLRRRR